MTTSYFHGTAGEATLHVGVCLTPSYRSAVGYATEKNCGGDAAAIVTTIEIELSDLEVVVLDEGLACDGQGNWTAPGDDGSPVADVVIFGDRGMYDEPHQTVRLMTEAAVAAARVVDVEELD